MMTPLGGQQDRGHAVQSEVVNLGAVLQKVLREPYTTILGSSEESQ